MFNRVTVFKRQISFDQVKKQQEMRKHQIAEKKKKSVTFEYRRKKKSSRKTDSTFLVFCAPYKVST